MNKNYIISSFLLSISCPTAIEGNTFPVIMGNEFCPVLSEKIPNNSELYAIGNEKPSYIYETLDEDKRDFEAILSFGRTYLQNEVGIDESIQKVINEHFWDML